MAAARQPWPGDIRVRSGCAVGVVGGGCHALTTGVTWQRSAGLGR